MISEAGCFLFCLANTTPRDLSVQLKNAPWLARETNKGGYLPLVYATKMISDLLSVSKQRVIEEERMAVICCDML